MKYLPIFLNLKNKKCLVVGGGEVATRKATVLLQAGATIRFVTPIINPSLTVPLGCELMVDNFQPGHFEGISLAIAATNDRNINEQISLEAQLRNIPVNVVDNPELCTFIMPSILDRSPLLVAFSTSGASPVLARLLRIKLETLIPQAYGRLASFAARFRNAVKQHIPHPSQRRIFWEEVLDGTIAEKIFSGDEETAEAMLLAQLQAPQIQTKGEVYLVGAGPGDPDLLTFRALRLMQRADVILYDNLVSKTILEMTRRDAQRIFVGKQSGNHTLPQRDINDLLVQLAKDGKRVLRLKGGDPFIFGRGGEEIESLAEHKIDFQVVPGITAASGVSSYAGIPLTHRDHAQSCVFVTGHLKNGTMDLDWNFLARPKQTIVVYMGLQGVKILCSQLIKHGLSNDTPIAIVQQGTTSNQRVITGSLSTLPQNPEIEQLHAPTLIIVGGVVSLRKKLSWYKPSKLP